MSGRIALISRSFLVPKILASAASIIEDFSLSILACGEVLGRELPFRAARASKPKCFRAAPARKRLARRPGNIESHENTGLMPGAFEGAVSQRLFYCR